MLGSTVTFHISMQTLAFMIPVPGPDLWVLGERCWVTTCNICPSSQHWLACDRFSTGSGNLPHLLSRAHYETVNLSRVSHTCPVASSVQCQCQCYCFSCVMLPARVRLMSLMCHPEIGHCCVSSCEPCEQYRILISSIDINLSTECPVYRSDLRLQSVETHLSAGDRRGYLLISPDR